MKKAFTLMEMLVCLALMAALIALFMTAIKGRPNTNMVMFRKAYNTTSQSVYEMLQSAIYYQTGELSDLDKTEQKVEDEYPQGTSKFCKIFASFVNTAGDIDCSSKLGTPSFTTLDGISWYLPPKTTSGRFSGKETIQVDVNGSETRPNCKEGAANCANPDIFEIKVSSTGKISIDGTLAKQYLQKSGKISK